MTNPIQGIKETLGTAIADGINLLRYIKAHPELLANQQTAKTLSAKLHEVGNTVSGIESHKKLVSACFSAASVGLDSREGLANLVFQQSMSDILGDLSGTGMSPTDPLSMISYVHQNIVLTYFNAITFQMTAMNLNIIIEDMYAVAKTNKVQVQTWIRTNSAK